MTDRKHATHVLAAAAILIAALAAGPAHATGLRLSGTWVMAGDASWDAFSKTDQRPGLDVSFSYSVLYLGRMFLVDVEGGYLHFTAQGDRLFDTYDTEILGHGMYLGLRVQFRHDRDWWEILQPFVRVDLGWSWTRAEIGSGAADLPDMHDWANGGFIHVGGGLQVTVPTAFIRRTLKIRATERFSIGFAYELGYHRPAPLEMKFSQPTGSGDGAEPIPVQGLDGGTLDLSGLSHTFTFVVTF